MQVGDIINNRFILQRHIGRGPRGECWLVEEQIAEKHLWLAKIYPLNQKNWERHDLIEREANLLRQLDHEMIPKFRALFVIKNERSLCLVREWLPGKNLEQFLEERRISEVDVRKIATTLLHGLSYTHGLSPAVLHRSIKPSNIIIQKNGQLHLTDFGSVKDSIDEEEGLSFFGTYGYTPTEQFLGKPSPASDLYALGATLIFLLSRHHPVHLPVERNRLQFEPYINVEPRFLRILQKLLAPNIEDRFQTSKDVLLALQKCDQSPILPNELDTHPRPPKNISEDKENKDKFLVLSEEPLFPWQRNRDNPITWSWEQSESPYQPNLEPIYEALFQRYQMQDIDRFGELIDLINTLDAHFGFHDETGRQWLLRLLHPYDAADILFGYYTSDFVLSRYSKELMKRFSLLHTHTANNAISQWILLYFLHKHGWQPQKLWHDNEQLPLYSIANKLSGSFQKINRFLNHFNKLEIGDQAKKFQDLQEKTEFVENNYHISISIRPHHLPIIVEYGLQGFNENVLHDYPLAWQTQWNSAFQLHKALKKLTKWPPRTFQLSKLMKQELKKYHRLGTYIGGLHKLYHDLELLRIKLQEEYHWLLPSSPSITPSLSSTTATNYKVLPELKIASKNNDNKDTK